MAVHMQAANQTYSVNLNKPTGNVSLAFWFRIASDRNAWSSLFSLDDGGPSGNFVVCQTDEDGVTLQLYPAAAQTLATAVSVGTWYYFGMSMTGGTATVRLRAQNAGSFTNKTATIDASTINQSRLLIGNSSFDPAGEWLNGDFASFRIWTGVALTAAELEAEYQYAAPLRTGGLTAFYRFDTASTTDNSGNGFTLSGGSGATTVAGPTGLIEPPGSTPLAFAGWGIPVF